MTRLPGSHWQCTPAKGKRCFVYMFVSLFLHFLSCILNCSDFVIFCHPVASGLAKCTFFSSVSLSLHSCHSCFVFLHLNVPPSSFLPFFPSGPRRYLPAVFLDPLPLPVCMPLGLLPCLSPLGSVLSLPSHLTIACPQTIVPFSLHTPALNRVTPSPLTPPK